MSHNIDKEDQHSWKEVPISACGITQKDLDQIMRGLKLKSVHICERGDCKCIRTCVGGYGQSTYTYSRSGTYYSTDRPDCFGDIPINEQKID